MSKRYWIETYGCQMNKAESGSLELELRARGWEPAAGPAAADAVVVNTCSVRQTAEDRIWGRLGFLKAAKRRRPFRLVLMGCMAERLKEEILRQAPQVDLLVGSFQKHRLAKLLDAPNDAAGVDGAVEWSGVGTGRLHTGAVEWSGVGAGRLHTGAAALTGAGPYRFSEAHSRGELRAFLPIMHGCDNFCTYCIVPYVRGREVSRSPESVLRELRELLPPAGAARDITLLGQNVNSYRYASGSGGSLSFPGLLRLLLPELAPGTWLRFLTSHPKDLSQELIDLVAAEPALCSHVHLPVQHGSDRVLAAMGRRYTRARYLNLVDRIRKTIPGVSLTTDILVGFPGETDEDHGMTLDLMRRVEFDDAFTYRYNPRKGTRAFDLADDVAEPLKLQRLAEVIDLQRRISRQRRRRRLGQRVTALVEAVSRKDPGELMARTEHDDTVVFPGPPERIGSFVQLRFQRLAGHTFRGQEVP